MTFIIARLRTRCILHNATPASIRAASIRPPLVLRRAFHSDRDWLKTLKKPSDDPRVNDIGRAIEDDYALIRKAMVLQFMFPALVTGLLIPIRFTATPKYPIVLAHGLMGFDELRLAGSLLPGVQYWRGITHAMTANGIQIITAQVPATGSIEERAFKLGQDIASKADGKSVNIIAHSMGGLDARYMISRLQPDNVEVRSLTTVATPHRARHSPISASMR